MKKFLLTFLVSLISVLLLGQQITKDLVLIEYFTETGCYYCPGAQLAADDFVNGGYNVAVIGYHYGDAFSNSATEARFGYYGISGTPTAEFNGQYEKVGGSHSSSVFSYWLPSYNNAVDDLTSFKLELNLESSNNIDFIAHLKAIKVADYSNLSLKLHAVVVETNIDYNWQGLNKINYVARNMYPDQNGTTISFADGDTVQTDINFSIDPSWNIDNCAIVVFLQDNSTKEVLQTVQDSLEIPFGDYNVLLEKVIMPSDSIYWKDTITPVVVVKNKGVETLNNIDFEYWVNREEHHTYSWSGTLNSIEKTEVELPPLPFNLIKNDTLWIRATIPNYDDADTSNNLIYKPFQAPPLLPQRLYLEMNTGTWGFEISYLLETIDGDTVKFFQANTGPIIVRDTFLLDTAKYRGKTYVFHLFDSYGNGFNSNDGYCKIYDAQNNEYFNVSGDFGEEFRYIFNAVSDVSQDGNITTFDVIKIYPTYALDVINVDLPDNGILQILDTQGKILKVFKLGNGFHQVNVSDLYSGSYIVKVITSTGVYVNRFIKH